MLQWEILFKKVKDFADYVAPTNMEDGVHEVISRFIFNK